MAWTKSALQRGLIAKAAVAVDEPKWSVTALQRAALATVTNIGRGDTARGLAIAFAAFLTLAGAATPHLPSAVMTALLFLTGATLVIFASQPAAERNTPDTTQAHTPTAQAAPRHSSSLTELLNPTTSASTTDRAAFARLTAHMSHELRTPLNAIIGFSELMSSEVFGPLGSTSYASYVRDIHASGISLLKSAEDALAITSLLTASGDHHKSAHAQPAMLAAEATAFHAPGFAARGLTSSCTIDPDADIIAAPQAVRQLLINLMADAAATAAPGTHIALTSRTVGCELEISVAATGPELPAASQAENFSMLLAHTLAELCGTRLQTMDRQVTIRFPHVAQNDFFSHTRRAA